MKFNATLKRRLVLACGIVLGTFVHAEAAEPVKIATRSKTETTIAASSEQQKYSLIMFWKNNDPATKAMWEALQDGLEGRSDQAVSLAVQVSDPAEAELVKQFGVSRAPMPLMLAVAPNGAVTASFAKRIEAGRIDEAFVTPTMTRCMLAMQNRKLVLLCVYDSAQSIPPQGVTEFQAVPCYQQTTQIVTMRSDDPAETKFLNELEITEKTRGTTTVFMAPPGVMLGKYPANVTKGQLIATLRAAGKGCGDENCKHCKP